jgi:hypothetical protein
MKKYLFLMVFFMIGAAGQISAQNQYADVISKTVNSYQKALLGKDYKSAAGMIHPRIVEMAGGQELYQKIMKEEYSQGGKLVDFKTLDPLPTVIADEEIHCIVPQEVTMKFGETNFKGVEHLLAASIDNGNSWYFVDLKTFDKASLKEFIPYFNDSLDIPANIPLDEVK